MISMWWKTKVGCASITTSYRFVCAWPIIWNSKFTTESYHVMHIGTLFWLFCQCFFRLSYGLPCFVSVGLFALGQSCHCVNSCRQPWSQIREHISLDVHISICAINKIKQECKYWVQATILNHNTCINGRIYWSCVRYTQTHLTGIIENTTDKTMKAVH